jgi:hypothetical protein
MKHGANRLRLNRHQSYIVSAVKKTDKKVFMQASRLLAAATSMSLAAAEFSMVYGGQC